MFVDIPAAILSSLGINGNYYTLASEFLCGLMNQLRTVDSCGIYRNLICTFTEKLPEIIYGTDSSAYGTEWSLSRFLPPLPEDNRNVQSKRRCFPEYP